LNIHFDYLDFFLINIKSSNSTNLVFEFARASRENLTRIYKSREIRDFLTKTLIALIVIEQESFRKILNFKVKIKSLNY